MQTPLATPSAPPHSGLTAADKGMRVVGYLIDVLPTICIGLLGFIPIAGAVLAGLLLLPYWLLRDIGGASLGKLALGFRVVSADGSEASASARLLRNLPLAVGPALLIIPFLGLILGPLLAFLVILIEGISLLSSGQRVGDQFAGTMVVKR